MNYNNFNEADISNPETSTSNDGDPTQPKFIDTINPLLSNYNFFSKDELIAMNEDVDELVESDSSDDESSDLGMSQIIIK